MKIANSNIFFQKTLKAKTSILENDKPKKAFIYQLDRPEDYDYFEKAVEKQVEKDPATEEKDELLKRLEAMENKIRENELEIKRKSLKSEIVSKLNEKGLKDNEWIETLLAEIPIGEDFDVESKVDNYLKLYNKSKASINTDITPDHIGGGGNGDEALAERMKKVAQYAKSQNLID
jgi:hypothetical protein